MQIIYELHLASQSVFTMKLFRYLHAYEDFNRKLGCTLVSTSQPDRGRYTQSRSLLSFRERTDRQLDVAAKLLLGRSTPGRRPSLLRDDSLTESKPAVDVKEEVCSDCNSSHKNRTAFGDWGGGLLSVLWSSAVFETVVYLQKCLSAWCPFCCTTNSAKPLRHRSYQPLPCTMLV